MYRISFMIPTAQRLERVKTAIAVPVKSVVLVLMGAMVPIRLQNIAQNTPTEYII
jgi:hypothetical protein